MAKKNWIDYKELKEQLDFEEVLTSYGVEITLKGDQHKGLCPLPGHEGEKAPSFSANLTKKLFNCFGCGGKGNIIDFAVLMEGRDRENKDDFRKTAVELRRKFISGSVAEDVSRKVEKQEPELVKEKEDVRVVVNKPLDFELQSLDPDHPYLKERGFNEETIEHFGLGFTSKGLMKDRICIPIRNENGELVGYAGRLVDDKAIDSDNPKYRFPGRREKDGVVYEFRKSELLYNAHGVTEETEGIITKLIVVEGFASVWWIHQCGFLNVVAVMGSSCSDSQAELITGLVHRDGEVKIMPDGDEAGSRLAGELLMKLSPHRSVRWVRLKEGGQPTACSPKELKQVL